ncbi:MAG TPA: class III poly(R)-hydroxyalkanoic acid synthase subunit PhaC [Dokdonella sp.]|uniref:class III poly(R)-hydroxyalkanoic acid synthase subunit PhaC n=1 Tax=Dokdonella sp. TaxID=2291710 RepID=UPI0025BDC3BF|nr:class III poly(R)-hydroxyalkanoic acid synthase subunit PhaC [Dokdonella sp.]MBX3693158.1 class III poly(R)-hydroxyalkanoic acid synthase subunit PhaC [Dokdonella sp.]MCW5567715.1 class III poly(R)-hydroxyalkanoic acid synthase subunit PhaC [Dokdonella sp.]HNR92121.1 class III poly(R)-hydroxyalkanoic acid synthase subunit PhaC [Dokdonella sp.]
MGPVRIEPAKLVDETIRFKKKLAAGVEVLRNLDDVDFGCTPKEEVYREDKLVVYRFRGDRAPTARVPTLIVYALVNRPYMVDLQEDKSLVRNLLAQGEDVYLIDWGYPDRADRWLTLDDYINGYIRRSVDAVARKAGVERINILGICQGGAFSLCFSAIYPHKVKNLITMVTPVDFHTPDNMLSNWTRNMDADLFVNTIGNVPADLMNWCYLTLKPMRLLQQKYVGMIDILDDKTELENFLRMEKWIFDSPDQAGEAFRQFMRDFYQGNKLLKGGLRIGDRAVDLKNITMPVLNIFAEQDHLVPPDSSRALKDAVGSRDYTQIAFKGGHIGIYVSGRAQREVPPAIHEWLKARS